MQFFGYSLTKAKDKSNKDNESFTPPASLDGALERTVNDYGFLGFTSDLEGTTITDETALITKYRNLSRQPEVGRAIDDIVNEAIVYDDDALPISLNLDEMEAPEGLKNKIRDEFDTVMKLLNFRHDSYEIFKRFYVDGRLYYHKIIDESAPKKGITELRYIDPRRIRKVREKRLKSSSAKNNHYRGYVYNQDLIANSDYDEFFLYNPNGISETNKMDGIKITIDTICYVHSGILDQSNKHVLSNLHKAIKIYNQLRWVEDSLVIYRVARAPERRVFNIEVGDLPKAKAEEYVQNLIRSLKKRTYYDASTGEVADDRRFSSIMEDYWFPKRDGKGTTVDQLAGGQNLGEIEDVTYFKGKLYEALEVPSTRLETGNGFNLGRASEITRDEVKFSKFINRLRKRFNMLFDDILGTQLVLKGIVKFEEWKELKEAVNYDYNEDNFFTELKEAEIIGNRFQQLQLIDPYIHRFVSENWVAKNVLHLNEDEWEQMKKEMEEEKEAGGDNLDDMGIDPDNPFNSQAPKKQPFGKKSQDDEDEDDLDIVDKAAKEKKKSKEDSRNLQDVQSESDILTFIKSIDDYNNKFFNS
ncbi:portal protein [Ochrobactrum phage vB_OspM_OC]|nr:portal protein [Ochrobactrum phage vB_OspM_OC]